MRKIIIATNNKKKVKEFKELLPTYDIVSLSDINYDTPLLEKGSTFKENAIFKAQTVAFELGLPVISDDSGIEVFSLGGAPGIYSARYAGEQHSDDDNNRLLLKNLKDIDNRECRYVCAIALCFPSGDAKVVEDYCYGEIILTPRGTNGFGYDPYFYLPTLGKTMAEISPIEKNAISHRGKALRRMVHELHENFNT